MGILIQVEGIGKYVNTSDGYCEFDGSYHPGGREGKYVNTSDRYCKYDGPSHLDGSGWKICKHL